MISISIAFASHSLYMNRPAPKNREPNPPESLVSNEKNVEEKKRDKENPASSYKADDWGLY